MQERCDEIDRFTDSFCLSDVPSENWDKLFEYKPELRDVYKSCGLWPATSEPIAEREQIPDKQHSQDVPVKEDGDFSKLNGREWSILLSRKPQFADQCDWQKLDDDCWFYLLYRQPQFADKCDLNNLMGFQLLFLLPAHPQLVHKIDESKFSDIELAACFQGIAQLPGGGLAPKFSHVKIAVAVLIFFILVIIFGIHIISEAISKV